MDDYSFYHCLDYTGYNHEQNYNVNSDALTSEMIHDPLTTDNPQSYPYFDEEATSSQDSWVSPIHYDPASGLYTQTFPPEYEEFLEEYGQRIEVPEYPELPNSGCVYEEDHSKTQAQLQPPEFQYYPDHTLASTELSEVSMWSPVNDHSEATSIVQYITSPPRAAARPIEHSVPRSDTGLDDYTLRPDVLPVSILVCLLLALGKLADHQFL